MLPKKHRLSKAADVKKTTAKGRSFFNPNFVLKSLPGSTEARATVVVSVKVSKNAVVRNRIKRVLREELRNIVPNFKPGTYVVIVKPSAAKIASAELRENFVEALRKIKS